MHEQGKHDGGHSDRQLLGVSLDAPVSEIRRAYFRAALRHHPDKTLGKETGAFVAVQQAYHRLLEHDSAAAISPKHGCKSEALVTSTAPLGSVLLQMMLILLQMFGGPHVVGEVDRVEMPRNKPDDITETIVVTLDELYHARVKKVVLKVRDYDGRFIHRKFLIPLLDHKVCHRFTGMGDVGRVEDGNGDVNIFIEISDHPSGVRADKVLNPFDLHVSVPTSLHDFVYGRDVHVMGLPGGEVSMRYGGSEQAPKSHVVIHERGLPFMINEIGEGTANSLKTYCRGRLYVFFDLQLPVLPESSAECDVQSRGSRTLLASMSRAGKQCAHKDGCGWRGGIIDIAPL